MANESKHPPVPWYRQPWPWVLIAIPLLAVVMGFVSLWLALSNPDYLVVDDEKYDALRSELRAQDHVREPDGVTDDDAD